jgi:hypothetical protein
MREAGTKSYWTPNVMKLMAEFHSSKGDNEKALTYIDRAQKIATEVLDGISVHIKHAKIMNTKADILIKMKKFKEALVECENALLMTEQVVGHKRSMFYLHLLEKKVNIQAELREEESKAVDTCE